MREYEIEPEPEPDVAAAIVEAFEQLAADDGWDVPAGEPDSAWRRAAREHAVDPGLE